MRNTDVVDSQSYDSLNDLQSFKQRTFLEVLITHCQMDLNQIAQFIEVPEPLLCAVYEGKAILELNKSRYLLQLLAYYLK